MPESNDTRQNDLTIFTVALLLGVFGNLLLRGLDCGLNASIWVLAIFATVFSLRRRGPLPKLSFAVCIGCAFALLFAWRDSAVLQALATSAIGAAICFAPLTQLAKRPSLLDHFRAFVELMGSVPVLLGRRLPAAAKSVASVNSLQASVTKRILRGLLFSLIPVAVFGWLFFAADATFELFVVDFFSFDLAEFGSATLFTSASGLVACAILYWLTVGPLFHAKEPSFGPSKLLGSIEINVVLGAVNTLFAVFVGLQLEYLFGGHERILDSAGPTYAEYAHRGFYELGTVSALAFCLLLALNALMSAEGPKGRRLFVLLSVAHIILSAVIVTSAFHRLSLYIDAYGLTQARFYAAAGVGWVLLSFAALGIAMVRASITLVPRVMTNAAYAGILALFAINPDAVIAKTNLVRVERGMTFDVDYAASLSADAVPVLVRGLNTLDATDGEALRAHLVERWSDPDAAPFREFNFGRFFARQTLERRS